MPYKNPSTNHFALRAGASPEHHSNLLRVAWKADRFARRRDRSLKGGPIVDQACCVQVAMESIPAANVCHSSLLHVKAVLSHLGHSSLSTISIKVSANFTKKPLTSSAFSRKYEAAAEPAKCAVHFRPCIDIHKGKVKQIVGSTLIDLNGESSTLITNFESEKSPAEFANMYKRDGLLGGHVIMLGADAASISAAIEALHAYPGGLQVGGGVNPDNAWTYLEAGASHVIVTSYVFNDGKMDLERLKDLVHVVGKGRLVLDLSCRKKDGKYVIVTDRWQKFSDVALDGETLDTLSTYTDEYLVHGVDVEGKRLGIDEELVGLLGRCSPIPVTYAGGATTLADLDSIRAAGAGSVDVTVGSALDIFGGNLSYKDVVAWHQKQLIDSQ